MKLTIEIPNEDIPRKQDILDISVHFMDGEICECTYPIVQDSLDKIRAEIQSASAGEWYVGRADGKTDEVVLMDDVMEIIDKYRK